MAVILLIALLAGAVYIDARYLAARSPSIYAGTLQVGPIGWLALTVCFSAVGATVYLFRRKRVLAEIAAAAAEHAAAGTATDERGDEQDDASSDGGATSPLRDVREFTSVTAATGATILALVVGIGVNLVYVSVNLAIGRTAPSIADASLLAIGEKLIFLGAIIGLGTRAGHSASELFSLDGAVKAGPDVLLPLVLGLALAGGAHLAGIGDSTVPVSPIGALADQSSAGALLVYALVAVLSAPILEELIFRGYYYRVVARVRGHRYALVAITVAFWLAHAGQLWGDWASLATILVSALVFTLLRMYRGSVVPGMIAHFAYNAAVVAIPLIVLASNAPLYAYVTSQDAPPVEREQLLKNVISADPEYTPAYNDLAWLYATEGGDLDEALSLVDHSLDRDPLNAAYRDTRAEVVFRLGRINEAITIERRLVNENPGDAYFRQQLSRFEAATGTAAPTESNTATANGPD